MKLLNQFAANPTSTSSSGRRIEEISVSDRVDSVSGHFSRHEVVNDYSRHLDRVAFEQGRTKFRTAGRDNGRSPEQRLTADRIGGKYIPVFVDQNLDLDRSAGANGASGRRITRFWQRNGLAVQNSAGNCPSVSVWDL